MTAMPRADRPRVLARRAFAVPSTETPAIRCAEGYTAAVPAAVRRRELREQREQPTSMARIAVSADSTRRILREPGDMPPHLWRVVSQRVV